MSTTLNIPASEIQSKVITAKIPVKSSVTLRDQPDDDAIDAHMRERQSPLKYSYALVGAFAEGHYTEF